MVIGCRVFFFFKQKTAYEMRISDWSSDVCSSDLAALQLSQRRRQDDDADDVAASLLIKLLRTLPISVEQDILPIGQHVFDRRARGAVAVAEYMRPFQECAVPRHFPQRPLFYELIIDSFLFPWALGSVSGLFGY